jgi:hypothetical protein
LNPTRESETIHFQKFATPKSNFAEVGFGAEIGQPKLHYSSRFRCFQSRPVSPTSDFGFNGIFQERLRGIVREGLLLMFEQEVTSLCGENYRPSESVHRRAGS